MKRAVVALSGGLDSTTTLYYARKRGYHVACLIFDYGQRHRKEIAAARVIARTAGCRYHVVRIRFPWKGSALLDSSLRIPHNRKNIAHTQIPITYVPARNTIFLSMALSFAETQGARAIFIGANALDYSGYPDCRPGYYRVFNRLSQIGTKAGVSGRSIRIHTPLIRKTKKDIVLLAQRLKVPLALTWSCYQGGARPCGSCDSCRLRAKGFREAGVADPARRTK